ncbi:MAG: hypothetical protein ACREQ5_00335 [Candidatus Dormibacteria bacterium]
MISRTDEAGFRSSVPRSISGLAILEVIGYWPGGDGCYACAYALATDDLRPGRFSTHGIIMADDHPEGRIRWYMEVGHYDFDSRSAAWDDLIERSAHRRWRVDANPRVA